MILVDSAAKAMALPQMRPGEIIQRCYRRRMSEEDEVHNDGLVLSHPRTGPRLACDEDFTRDQQFAEKLRFQHSGCGCLQDPRRIPTAMPIATPTIGAAMATKIPAAMAVAMPCRTQSPCQTSLFSPPSLTLAGFLLINLHRPCSKRTAVKPSQDRLPSLSKPSAHQSLPSPRSRELQPSPSDERTSQRLKLRSAATRARHHSTSGLPRCPRTSCHCPLRSI